MMSSCNLFIIYMTMEIQALCFYSLTALNKRKLKLKSIEASFKYLLYGSFSSSFFLIGTGLMYYTFGTVNLLKLTDLLFHINLVTLEK